jgi:hypothetical protein
LGHFPPNRRSVLRESDCPFARARQRRARVKRADGRARDHEEHEGHQADHKEKHIWRCALSRPRDGERPFSPVGHQHVAGDAEQIAAKWRARLVSRRRLEQAAKTS